MSETQRADQSLYVQQVESDGYAIVEKVISPHDVSALIDAVAELPIGDEIRRKRSTYGVRNLLEICPEVRRLAVSVPIRSLVTPILDEHCFAARAIFFDKTSDANWKLGWHQDSVISVRERIDVPAFVAWSQKAGVLQVQPPAEVLANMLAIRVHLDESHANNGPLRVLPGSHKLGWLDDEVDEWKRRVPEVVCQVPVGGVAAMRPLLIHASSASVEPTHRRVIHIEFAFKDLPGGLEWNQRVMPPGENER
jgi:ectoine hydroxylase-related dioxygenase (phytanoyl-CoA dioxygenase family)